MPRPLADLGNGLPYSKDRVIQWAGFSSTAKGAALTAIEPFLGSSGERTIFQVLANPAQNKPTSQALYVGNFALTQVKLCEGIGRSVAEFSMYPEESEVLLPPNIQLVVKSIKHNFLGSVGLTLVELWQQPTQDVIVNLDPSLEPSSELQRLLHAWWPSTKSIAAAVGRAIEAGMALHGGTPAELLKRGEALLATKLGIASMELEPLIASLNEYAEAAGVLSMGLERLAQLFDSHPDSLTAVLSILPMIIAGMCKHEASPGVQSNACLVLAKFCLGSDAYALRHKLEVVNSGALSAIITGMCAHEASQTVQHFGCIALRHICDGSNASAFERKHAAVDAGALKAIIAGMSAHEASAEVQRNGCISLYIITAGSDNWQEQAVELGAPRESLSGMVDVDAVAGALAAAAARQSTEWESRHRQRMTAQLELLNRDLAQHVINRTIYASKNMCRSLEGEFLSALKEAAQRKQGYDVTKHATLERVAKAYKTAYTEAGAKWTHDQELVQEQLRDVLGQSFHELFAAANVQQERSDYIKHLGEKLWKAARGNYPAGVLEILSLSAHPFGALPKIVDYRCPGSVISSKSTSGVQGITALREACFWGNTNIVGMLLEYGADTELVDSNGDTALIVAVRWNQQECVEHLLKHGADYTAQTVGTKADTSLSLAKDAGMLHMLQEHIQHEELRRHSAKHLAVEGLNNDLHRILSISSGALPHASVARLLIKLKAECLQWSRALQELLGNVDGLMNGISTQEVLARVGKGASALASLAGTAMLFTPATMPMGAGILGLGTMASLGTAVADSIGTLFQSSRFVKLQRKGLGENDLIKNICLLQSWFGTPVQWEAALGVYTNASRTRHSLGMAERYISLERLIAHLREDAAVGSNLHSTARFVSDIATAASASATDVVTDAQCYAYFGGLMIVRNEVTSPPRSHLNAISIKE